jgi:hypothetical protein
MENDGKAGGGSMWRRYTLFMIVILFLMGATGCQVNHIDSAALTPDKAPTASIQNNPAASPRPQPTVITYADIPTKPADEFPAAGSSLTFAQHGVTVTLTRLEVSSTQTILDFVAALDPVWGFSFGQYDNPAQDAFPNDSPTIVDETGHDYQIREFHGGVGPGRYVDSQTGIAYTAGRFVFEPVTGSRLEIAIPLMLFTVRASKPIRFTVANPDRSQSLAINRSLVFGELSAQVKSAEWKSQGNFELTLDGSVQEEDLRPVCLYLYQDPEFPPASYKGCFIDERVNVDPSERFTFIPLPDFSHPVEVQVAANIIFLEPFRFTWIRNK